MDDEKQSQRKKLMEGFERLAFGNITDAVRLLFCDELNIRTLNKLDLFLISEIKRPKGGGIEIKFFDRLKALQCLEEMYHQELGDHSGFYRALEQGVHTFEEDES